MYIIAAAAVGWNIGILNKELEFLFRLSFSVFPSSSSLEI
jgi:hypothetical protein